MRHKTVSFEVRSPHGSYQRLNNSTHCLSAQGWTRGGCIFRRFLGAVPLLPSIPLGSNDGSNVKTNCDFYFNDLIQTITTITMVLSDVWLPGEIGVIQHETMFIVKVVHNHVFSCEPTHRRGRASWIRGNRTCPLKFCKGFTSHLRGFLSSSASRMRGETSSIKWIWVTVNMLLV